MGAQHAAARVCPVVLPTCLSFPEFLISCFFSLASFFPRVLEGRILSENDSVNKCTTVPEYNTRLHG